MDRIPVKFTQGYSVYNAGEIAGFEADRAAQLIEAGVAVEYVAPEAGAATGDDAKSGGDDTQTGGDTAPAPAETRAAKKAAAAAALPEGGEG